MDFNYTGAIQTYTISQSGLYTIECWGASGGGANRATCGLGAYSRSTFYLNFRDILKILVAGQGQWDGTRGGGGGGSFVELNSSTLLCVAGGGGGSMFSRTPNNYSHGQSVQGAGNYNLTGIKTNYAAGGNAYAGSGGGGYSGDGTGMTCTPPTHAFAWIYGGKSFKNGGAFGYGNVSTNAGGYTVNMSSSPKGGFGGGGGACFLADIGGMGGVEGYYFNGAGGGGGYTGGDSTRDGYGNTAGGGGSYFVGTTGIELAKSGYEAMPTIINSNITMIGNFGNGFVRVSPSISSNIIFTDGDKYYIPTKDFFNIYTKTFRGLTLSELEMEIDNKTDMPMTLMQLNMPITINGETFLTSDIMDLTQYKICIISPDNLNKVNIKYIPSPTALSKTTIKVKDEYRPFTDKVLNPYVDIISDDKSNISYNMDYEDEKDVMNINASLLYQEYLKDNFYLSFLLNDINSLLKSVILYSRDLNNYSKIKEDHINVDADYINTYITFKAVYSEVLINKITKQYFKYLNDALDKF